MTQRETVVYRHLAIPVRVFDHIKDVQRTAEDRLGARLSLMETIALIVLEHQRGGLQDGERGERQHDGCQHSTPALLRA